MTDNGDNTFSYAPDADFNGTDSFTYTITDGNGLTSTASVYLTVSPTPDVTETVINEVGSVQRSSIKQVTIMFDSLVDVPTTAFSLTNLGKLTTPVNVPVTDLTITSSDVGGVTMVVIQRTSVASLDEGNYRLDIDGSQVMSRGTTSSMSGDYAYGDNPLDKFFRLYGDDNGDGNVDFDDFAFGFLPAFGTDNLSPMFRSDLDFDDDGFVDFDDFAAGFLPRFGLGR